MFGIGVFELLIILVIAGIPVAALVAILVAIVVAGKKNQRP
jgi:hypothetical protein